MKRSSSENQNKFQTTLIKKKKEDESLVTCCECEELVREECAEECLACSEPTCLSCLEIEICKFCGTEEPQCESDRCINESRGEGGVHCSGDECGQCFMCPGCNEDGRGYCPDCVNSEANGALN